ncbi:hypothetical protein MHBO_000158 [Bonamia ostreae]|uniref:Uncharacterized protein n=1 Tax=Bonamia ostreae TaxID=126728 RepID=A0ABV2AEM9_9EUKA
MEDMRDDIAKRLQIDLECDELKVEKCYKMLRNAKINVLVQISVPSRYKNIEKVFLSQEKMILEKIESIEVDFVKKMNKRTDYLQSTLRGLLNIFRI